MIRRVPVAALLCAAAIALTALLALFGVASWPPLIAAAAPWLLLATRRWGIVLAAPLVLLATLLAFVAALMATAAAHLAMVGSVTALAVVVGAAGTALVARGGRTPRPRVALPAVLAPLLGSAVWLGVLGAAQLVPGAARLSWVMLGDAANNVLFAREVVYRGGIGVGAAENPVPLPTAVLGYVIDAGRSQTASADLLRHDIAGFALTWGLLIALSCALAGMLAAVLVRRAGGRPLAEGVSAALASLVPLSWFATGYPIEFGFFNTHLALIVLTAAFIAYLRSSVQPAVAIAALAIAAVLLLAVWSPLVLLPAALGLVVVARRARALVATRGLALALLLSSLAIAVGYLGAVVVPSLLFQGGFLSAGGGIIVLPKLLLPASCAVVVAIALVAFRSIRDDAILGALAIAAASALGLAALLVVAGGWSYYPVKFAWLASVFLRILGVAFAGAAVVRLAAWPARYFSGYTALAVAVALLSWWPLAGASYTAVNPVSRILTGQYYGSGDALANTIFDLADPAQARVLFDSGDHDEGAINFWLLQLWADSTSANFDLRAAAYHALGPTTAADLCDTLRLMHSDVTVITRDGGLESTMNDLCPDDFARATVEVMR